MGVIQQRRDNLTVVLENIHDPHNVSAILRSADAVGICEVQLCYWNEKFPKLGKKSSASASKWISCRRFSIVKECYDTLHSEGYRIAATRLGEKSASLYDIDFTGKVAVVFGNEHRGVSDEAGELADLNFLIPMTGMIQSLNVSVACAVTLYEAFRQNSVKTGGGALPPERAEAMLKEWIAK